MQHQTAPFASIGRRLFALSRDTGRLHGRVTRAVATVWEELLVAAVPSEERAVLTAICYDRERLYVDPSFTSALFPWEEEIFDAWFPSPPARVLVGGCGGGREVAGLLARGYEVVAFDPVARFVQYTRTSLGRPRLPVVEQCSYEELVAGCPPIEAAAPFDAVVLGWTSLNNVLRDTGLVALLRKLQGLAPGGAVMAGYLEEDAREAVSGPRARLRDMLRSAGLTHRRPGDRYRGHLGFYREYDRDHLTALATAAGVQVRFVSDIYPVALFTLESSSR